MTAAALLWRAARNVREDVPLITGLTFDSMVLNETLAIEDEGVYSGIMNLTQLLKNLSLRWKGSNWPLTKR